MNHTGVPPPPGEVTVISGTGNRSKGMRKHKRDTT